MKLTHEEAEKVRQIVATLGAMASGAEPGEAVVVTRDDVAESVGMTDSRDFRIRIWHTAQLTLQHLGICYRSDGGGGRYKLADWRGKMTSANNTLRAAKKRFGRAAMRLPSSDEVPEHARFQLAKTRERMTTAAWRSVVLDDAAQQIVATAPAKLPGCKSKNPGREGQG